MGNVLVGEDEREQRGIGDDVEQHRAHVGGGIVNLRLDMREKPTGGNEDTVKQDC